MLSPALTRDDVLAKIRMQIGGAEQFERLSSIRFKGKRHFEKNNAYPYEAEIFHDMCNYSVTPDRISELLWANAKYNNGEEAVAPRTEPFTIRNVIKGLYGALKSCFKNDEGW